MKILKKIKAKIGFTLVELLIVIVIIGIMSSIGGFRYYLGQEQAQLNNVFSQVVFAVRQARNLALSGGSVPGIVNGAEVEGGPYYFETVLDPAAFKIEEKGYGVYIDPTTEKRTQLEVNYPEYGFTAPSDFKLNFNEDPSKTNSILIEYYAPLGDLKIKYDTKTFDEDGNKVFEEWPAVKVTVTSKNNFTKSFCLDIISGTIEYCT